MKFYSNRKSYEKRKRLPQGEKTKNPKVMAASLASIVISVLIFLMVVIIGIVGFASGEKVVSEQKALNMEGPFHIWFYWNDNEVFYESSSFEMSAPMVIPEEVGYFPADGIAAALGGTYEYNKDKGTVKFRNIDKNVKLTVGSNEMKIGWFKTVTMDDVVYVEGDTVYVPLRSFFEALGYGLTFSPDTSRFDVFVPDEGTSQVPSVSFSTDKDVYQVGEKVTFTVNAHSPQGYEIVEEKWENRSDWYFESGEVTVTCSVKDYKGNWSTPISKTITIEGEYNAADKVPVLSYYYIVEDSSQISKKVKEEKEVKEKDPNDPSKEVTKKVEEEKLVKGPYYGDEMVISLEQFEEEMAYLAENGIKTLTVSEYLEYREAGVMPPEDSVLILFVNGYESTYTLAYPVLKEYGLKANVAPEVKVTEDRTALAASVAAGEEGAQENLDAFDEEYRFPVVTFYQLEEMISEGTFEVGCISYQSYQYGEDVSVLAAPINDETEEQYTSRVNDDVAEAVAVLSEQLGRNNEWFFIYPYGETSEVLTAAVQNAGFTAAFIEGESGYILPESEPFALEYMNVTQSMSNSRFRGLF